MNSGELSSLTRASVYAVKNTSVKYADDKFSAIFIWQQSNRKTIAKTHFQ